MVAPKKIIDVRPISVLDIPPKETARTTLRALRQTQSPDETRDQTYRIMAWCIGHQRHHVYTCRVVRPTRKGD